MPTNFEFRNEHQISDEWRCYEYYDKDHDRWRWALVHLPTDDAYFWLAGCGMPVEEIDPETCAYIADILDDQDCNVCAFHPFSWYVEQAKSTISQEDTFVSEIKLVLSPAQAEYLLSSGDLKPDAIAQHPIAREIRLKLARAIDNPEKPEMTIELAKQIVGQCVAASLYRLGITDQLAEIPDCELEELLVANRLMAGYTETNEDSSTSIFTRVDPRGLAAMYALKHYQNDPRALLEALGYRLSDDEEG